MGLVLFVGWKGMNMWA